MPNQFLGVGNPSKIPGPYVVNYLMYTTLPSGSAVTRLIDVTAGGTGPSEDTPMGWYSERLAAPFSLTTSSVITIAITDFYVGSDPGAKCRFTLSKVFNTGDLNTVQDIATVDGSALDATVNKNTYTFTIPADVEMARGERFLLRIWAIPTGATYAAASSIRFQYAASIAGSGQATLAFPAGMTFTPAKTLLYFRRDASAVGGNFYQLLTTRSAVASTTGVVQTANVSQIQWTRTAGGTVLEWISPRVKDHWLFQQTGITGAWIVSATIVGFESAATANAGVRVKVFRWRAGVEAECLTMDWTTAELGTTQVTFQLADTGIAGVGNIVVTPTDFQVDDRIVARLYAIPIGGAMPAGQTATFVYDDSATSTSRLQLLESPDFKAESDPAEPPTPPQSTMTGMGL